MTQLPRRGSPPGRGEFGSKACQPASSSEPRHHRFKEEPRYSSRGGDRSNRATDEQRRWIYGTMPRCPPADRFVVASYNILGADIASQHWRELYAHVPAFIMDWDKRKRNILQEIGLWSPDILCLQEVDRFDELQNDLVQRGYEGIFKERTGDANDGCAMFWRPARFQLLEEESIEFKELDMRNNVAQLCIFQAMSRKREQSKSRTTMEGAAENCLVVCNIHVLFNPNRGDIKLGQVRHLLMKAHSMSQKMGGIPVILTGDFNSIPQSPLYQFLLNSMLNVSCFDRRKISGQVETSHQGSWNKVDRWTSTTQFYGKQKNEELWLNASHSVNYMQETMTSENFRHDLELIVAKKAQLNAHPQHHYGRAAGELFSEIPKQNMSRGSFHWMPEELNTATGDPSDSIAKHSFKLQSAYSSIPRPVANRDSVGEPLATTYHKKFMGTVDYIWFSEGLIPLRVLDILPIHVLQRTRGLPSKKWGSDHMALACEFTFLSSKKTTKADVPTGERTRTSDVIDLTMSRKKTTKEDVPTGERTRTSDVIDLTTM